MSELVKRSIVAVIGIPLAIYLIYLGAWYFSATLIFLSAIAQHEFYGLAKAKGDKPFGFFAIIMAVIFQFFFAETVLSSNHVMAILPHKELALAIMLLIIPIFPLGSLLLQLFSNKDNAMRNISQTVMGFMYVPVLLSALILIRESNLLLHFMSYSEAGWLVLAFLVSIWVCDSAAYFTGMAIGKHKLYPRVSPKKTWEGAIGGFFGGIIGFSAMTYFLIPDFPLVHAAVLGAISGTIGQIGDLVESQLKRDAGVKDSSNLIPGHGGMLDRLDSIIFTAPFAFMYLVIIKYI